MSKVLIISYYFNLRDTDRAFSVYKYFKNSGYEVQLYCGNFDHNSKKFVKYGITELVEIPVIAYKKNISLLRIISHIKFGLDVKKQINNAAFDIGYIIAPPNSTGYILKNLFKKKKVKFVLDIYDVYPETIPINEKLKKILKYLGFGLWSYLRNAAIKQADLVISSCKYYFTRLGIKESNKYHIIPLCKGDVLGTRQKNSPLSSLNILYLGALTGNYDFESLVAVLKGLKANFKTVKLHIIGDGNRKKWLLNELNINDIDYEFFGPIYDDDRKSEIMGQCHFGFNGFKSNCAIALSYKSMEYLSNGLALINCCKEDTWELVEREEIGFNYKPDCLDKLIIDLLNIDEKKILEMQIKAIEVYKVNFTFGTYCRNMHSLFDNLISEDTLK